MLTPTIWEDEKQIYYQKEEWREETLYDIWQKATEQFAARTYITDSRGMAFTYEELDHMVLPLSAYLKEQGIQPGDVICAQLPVWWEMALLMLAAWRVGAVLCPLSVTLEKKELGYFFHMLSPRLFVCPTKYHHRNFAIQAQNTVADMETPPHLLLVEQDEMAPQGEDTLKQVLATRWEIPQPAKVSADAIALVLCTSGTTGDQKGVQLTHNNILFAERVMNDFLGLTQDDVMFMPSPLNHATGFQHGLVAPILHGARVALLQRYTPEKAVAFMQEQKCTYSMGASTFVHDILGLLEQTGQTLPSMRFYLCGGAPVSPSMVKRAEAFHLPICEVYGQTESTPHVIVPPSRAVELCGKYSGRPMDGVAVKVIDDDGNRVPNGTEGELCSKGPQLFCGYVGQQGSHVDAEGYFHSGDLGVLYDNGYLKVTGRKKELLIRGGENLHCVTLNRNLEVCDALAEHAIVGMPDERLGERICAYGVLKEGRTLTLQELCACLQEHNVPKYQWPERLELVEELPKTDSGKIKSHLLKADITRKLQEEQNP